MTHDIRGGQHRDHDGSITPCGLAACEHVCKEVFTVDRIMYMMKYRCTHHTAFLFNLIDCTPAGFTRRTRF